jgi:hypothetical protein
MTIRLMLVTGATVVASVCAVAGAVMAQTEARTFQTGITGSAPSGPGNPTVLMSTPVVRQVLLDLAEGAIGIADASRRLAGSPYDVTAIVDAGLACIHAGTLRLALNYVSGGDQRLISTKARGYGRELADLLLARSAVPSCSFSLAAWRSIGTGSPIPNGRDIARVPPSPAPGSPTRPG